MGCKKRSTLNIHKQGSRLTLTKNKCMWTLHLFSVWGCSEIFDGYSHHKFQVLLYNLDS